MTTRNKEHYSKRHESGLYKVYSMEARWAFAAIAVFSIASLFADHIFISENVEILRKTRLYFLVPSSVFPFIMVLVYGNLSALRLAYGVCVIGHLMGIIYGSHYSDGLLSAYLTTMSIGLFTLCSATVNVIPRSSAAIGGLHAIVVISVNLFYFGSVPSEQSIIALTVIFTSIISNGFMAVIFLGINAKVYRLSLGLSERIVSLQETEALLNFALVESKQTVVYKDGFGIHQFPVENKFSELTSNLPATSILPMDLISKLQREGFHALHYESLSGEGSSNLRVLEDPDGNSYVATMTTSPTGVQMVLLSNVTQIIQAGILLDAALSSNDIGVTCFDSKGNLIVQRGAKIDSIFGSHILTLAGFQQELETPTFTANSRFQVERNGQHYEILTSEHGKLRIATFINVTRRMQTEKNLRETQKMSLIGELTSGVAHDYNNILAIILTNLEVIKKLEGKQPIDELIDCAIESVHHAADISKKLLTLAGKQSYTIDIICVAEAIDTMKNLFGSAVPENIRLDFNLNKDLYISSNFKELQTALLNLLVNAKTAIGDKDGTITIETTLRDNNVVVAMIDDGPGINADIRDDVFNPFFTTQTKEFSTGLGLSMVKGFVEQSRGFVTIPNTKKGTRIEMHFPLRVPADATNEIAQFSLT